MVNLKEGQLLKLLVKVLTRYIIIAIIHTQMGWCYSCMAKRTAEKLQNSQDIGSNVGLDLLFTL